MIIYQQAWVWDSASAIKISRGRTLLLEVVVVVLGEGLLRSVEAVLLPVGTLLLHRAVADVGHHQLLDVQRLHLLQELLLYQLLQV
jgi:hypothetical protein